MNFRKLRKVNALKSIWWSDNCNTPFEYVVLIDQPGRETINRILTKICNAQKPINKNALRNRTRKNSLPYLLQKKSKQKPQEITGNLNDCRLPFSCFWRRRLAWDDAMTGRFLEIERLQREFCEIWGNGERDRKQTLLRFIDTEKVLNGDPLAHSWLHGSTWELRSCKGN